MHAVVRMLHTEHVRTMLASHRTQENFNSFLMRSDKLTTTGPSDSFSSSDFNVHLIIDESHKKISPNAGLATRISISGEPSAVPPPCEFRHCVEENPLKFLGSPCLIITIHDGKLYMCLQIQVKCSGD